MRYLRHTCHPWVVSCLVFLFVLGGSAVNGIGQLIIDSISVSGLVQHQTKNKNNFLDNQILSLESQLTTKFSIADFVKKAKFKLAFSDETALDPLDKTIQTKSQLDLPIALSESVENTTSFQVKSKFLPNNSVKDKAEASLGTAFELDMKPLKSSFSLDLSSTIFTNEPVKNQNDVSVGFSLEGKQSKPDAKAKLEFQYDVTSFPFDRNEDNTELKFKTQGSGDVSVAGENSFGLLAKYEARFKDKDLRADPPGDANGDGCPGVCGVDDDGDGFIDEDKRKNVLGDPKFDPAFIDDDDEDGIIDDTGDEFKQLLNVQTALGFSDLLFFGDLDVQAEYDFQDSAKMDKLKDQSKTRTLGVDVSSKRKFDKDTSLKTKFSLEQAQEAFPLSSTDTNEILSQKFKSQLEWQEIQLTVERRQKEKTFPKDTIKNTLDINELVEISFPVGENLSMELTLLDHHEKQFPNNPVKNSVDDTKAIQLKMKLKKVYQWKVAIEIGQTTFPFDVSKVDENTMKATAAFNFTPLETFKIGLKFVTKLSVAKDTKQDNGLDFTFDIDF